MNLDKLKELTAQGYLRSQTHPDLPYTIWNYTEKTNYEGTWNEYTLACRGLILDGSGNVIARPFRKFFNHGQAGAPEIALDEPVTVTDKMDGSLGILYPTSAGHAIATRGAFESEQAVHATMVWQQRYAPIWAPDPWLTYMFEIVYPANRIVVNYGAMDDLVLLGAVDTGTGASFPLDKIDDWPGPRADALPYRTFAEALAAPDRPDAEGVVVYVPDTDERVKIKQEDYLRLHKAVTGLNARAVWEALAGGGFEAFIAGLPDEFHAWANDVAEQLVSSVEAAEQSATVAFEELVAGLNEAFWTRKDFAIRAAQHPQKALLFALLDGKDIATRLWRDARPDPGWTPSGRTFSEDNA